MNDPQPEGHMASHIERRKFLATLGVAGSNSEAGVMLDADAGPSLIESRSHHIMQTGYGYILQLWDAMDYN
jgi:hypothetical protein